MKIFFAKMHGLGNDFVVIDFRKYQQDIGDNVLSEFSKRICNRRFGIGADQLLLLYPSGIADFKMRIFNADGGEVEMCGNGIRCLAKYIWDRKISEKDILEIETLAGIIKPERIGEYVRVDMGKPILVPCEIPVKLNTQSSEPLIDFPLKIKDRLFKITTVSMGNPHAVIFVDEDINEFPVSLYGPEIEKHEIFPKKTNVEFINVLNRRELVMRVWERGAGETLACGTGASASAVAAILKNLTDRKVIVRLPGGELFIEWNENNHVYMTGPAVEVFEGYFYDFPGRTQERRQHKRMVYTVHFEYALMGKKIKTFKPGITVDISDTGIGIVSDTYIEPGQMLLIKEKDQKEYKIAIVKWSMKIGNRYRAGLMINKDLN